MIMSINRMLSWYQNKIGSYDKHSWERSVEKFILKGISNIPKKSAKIKTDFIDVDFVRGTVYPKAKSQHGMFAVARKAAVRTLFMPFYLHWWQEQTTKKLAWILLVMYLLQISAILIFILHCPSKEWEDISTVEVISPSILLVILGVIHSQVVSTDYTGTSSVYISGVPRKRMRRRRQPKATKTTNSGGRRSCQSGSNVESLQDCDKQSSGSGEDTNSETPASSESRNPLLPSFSTDSGVSLTPKSESKALGVNEVVKCVSFENGHEEARLLPRFLDVPNVNEDITSDEARHDSAVQDVSSVELETDQHGSDTEVENAARIKQVNMNAIEGKTYMLRRRLSSGVHGLLHNQHRRPLGSNSSGDSEVETTSPDSRYKEHGLASDMEWGMTTNTDGEEQSYESDSSDQIKKPLAFGDDLYGFDFNGVGSSSVFSPSCPASDKVNCTVWEGRECKKAELCVLDISSAIVRKVAKMPQSTDYFYSGILLAVVIALLPAGFRSHESARDLIQDVTADMLDMSMPSTDDVDRAKSILALTLFGNNFWIGYVVMVVIVQRFILGLIFFFLLSVAERTFKQRFLHAKLFTHLTSSRRSRRSDLPYFRLNKVRNIKTWLSVRSYLKKHGPQRSVDVIVSAAFVIALILISFLCIQVLKESENFGDRLYNWEVLCWSFALGVYLLRFMILGAKINKKYRNFSALLTEQINLYVQMDQKPHKKESLILANNVLKLASQLLKELESPFKISGLSANPYLYNITKLVILSAFSAVLTELLGFKLKLYKIKIK
ncbi:hypothetical protein CHUAL_001084 [Chamberlinius hualienensis]